ncbi:DUF4139 domain-containing protein [Candidatus Micrarchaeota archaeon]|nr:DUF4139 domain-containing protein [Candidatus Micrarchaeota archaeon]
MEIKYAVIGLVIIALGFAGITYLQQPQEHVYRIQAQWNLQQQALDSASETPESVEITVYQVEPQQYYYPIQSQTGFNIDEGIALIKEKRSALFPAGLTSFAMKGTAQHIDSTSLHLKDFTDPAIAVLEQNYHYDLVSQSKLLQKFLNKPIEVLTENGLVAGTLLSSRDGLVLKNSNGIVSFNEYKQVNFPSLPEGLVTVPTINWLLGSHAAGEHDLEVSYLASGLNWHADYVAVVNEADTLLDLQGWVSLQNRAGATFENAKLKLIAGDIHLVRGQKAAARYPMVEDMAMGAAPAPQFTEEGLFEYHLYSLQRPTTLKDNEDKQIALFTAENTGVQKQYVFDSRTSDKVQVKLNFDNSEENNLGMPMPKGKVRVYKADSEGQLQFLGEDEIDHTPKDETIRLFIGNAFDITAVETQTNYEKISSCQRRESYKVEIRNHKEEPITVTVLKYVYSDWEIVQENFGHVKESSTKASWQVPVAADGTETLTYTARIKYC